MINVDVIGIGADTREIKVANRDLDTFGKSADNASRKADGLGNSITGMVKGFIGISAGVAGLREIANTLDEYTKYTVLLKNATSSQNEFNQAMADVRRIASTAQTDVAGLANTYARFSNSLKEFGTSQKDIATLTETVALGLKANGASAMETSSAMLQLSQAFAAGRLSGDEFRSMAEAAPSLMRALAQSIGVPTGALKEMAAEGKLTNEVLLKAFTDPALLSALQSQAKEVTTISGAWQVFKNEVSLFTSTAGSQSGVIEFFTKSIGALSLAVKEMNQALSTGKITLDSWLPAYEKYRTKMKGENKKIFSFKPTINQALSEGGFENLKTDKPSIIIQDPLTDKEMKAQEKALEKQKKAYQKTQKEIRDQAIKELQDEIDFETDQHEATLANIAERDKKEKASARSRAEFAIQQFDIQMTDRADKIAENYKHVFAKEKELRREYERTSDFLSRTIADGLMRGFESGKSFMENFKDTLVNMFQTLVLQPTIKMIIDKSGITGMLAGVGSLFSGGAMAGEGVGDGASGIMDKLSNIGDIFIKGDTALSESILGLGNKLLDNGFEKLGDLVLTNSNLISNVLPFAGSAISLLKGDTKGALSQAIGAGIGGSLGLLTSAAAFSPMLAGIGAIAGSLFGSVFGGSKKIPRFSSQSVTQYNGGDYTTVNSTPKYKALKATEQTKALNTAFFDAISPFFKSLAIDSELQSAKTLLLQKRTNSYGIFNASINGQEIKTSVTGSASSTQKTFEKLIEKVMSDGVVKAIKASSLSDGIKKFFDGLTDKDETQKTITSLISLNSELRSLPAIFDSVRNAIDTTAYSTSIDALNAQMQATKTFVDLFYSESEKRAIVTNQLTTAFADLDQVMPKSRSEYRKLVESIKVSDEATRDLYNGLISLAPAMSQYLEAIQGGVAERQQSSFSNVVDFNRYRSLQSNVGTEYANMTTMLIDEVRQLRKEMNEGKNAQLNTAKYTQETSDFLRATINGDAALTTQAA